MTVSTPLPLSEPPSGAPRSLAPGELAALVLLFGLAIRTFLGYRAYTSDPPIAAQVVTPAWGGLCLPVTTSSPARRCS